ncbi:MAG: glycosyl transferase family 1, partial [Hydrogenophaga sp.]|nr:glycosyl transferase family 1 [Hydrogenophaga sp.]
ASGEVVGIADSQAMAEAIVGLLGDPERWHAAARAGMARVETFYTHPTMFGRYRAIYDEALGRVPGQDALTSPVVVL